jgi:uncharacterized protein YcbK (DUF882 family)
MSDITGTFWEDLQFFTYDEFTCKCGCGRNEMKHSFMLLMDDLRNSYGHPIRISSGYRCPDYNSNVSSTGRDGPHTTGSAADILISGGQAFDLLFFIMQQGFSGVGVAQKGLHSGRFLHVDTLTSKGNRTRPWIWTY